MSDFALPLLFALAIWWSATAVVMFLDGLPRTTFRWTLLGTTALQLVALYGLWETRDDTSVFGAYVAFACAVATWGWQEVFFLTGAITVLPPEDHDPGDPRKLLSCGYAQEGVELRIVGDDLPYIPLYRRTLTWAMTKKVSAVQWPNDSAELRWARIQ